MSLQKAATILNVLNQNLAAMAEAEYRGIDSSDFLRGMLVRMGWQAADIGDVKPFIDSIAAVIKAP